MSSFLNSTDVYQVTGAMMRLFETVSSGHFLTVFKEPKREVERTTPVYAGYNESSIEDDVTLVPVSGVFPCQSVTNRGGRLSQFGSLNIMEPSNSVFIKVKPDAKEFIEDGINEYFLLDGITYKLGGDTKPQNFLGLVFYIYNLVARK